MKKFFAFLVVSVITMPFLTAQVNMFVKGDKVLNLGIGFGGLGIWGYNATVPPISASYEVGILENVLDVGSIGVGGFIAYASYKAGGYATDYYTFNRLVISARGTFHYPLVDNFDTYAGLMVGFNSNRWKWHGTGTPFTDNGGTGLYRSVFVGGRYYFTEKFAGFGELGYGITLLNLGLSIKL